MYECMYVCMYACMYVCTYVRTYVRMYVHVCMYVRIIITEWISPCMGWVPDYMKDRSPIHCIGPKPSCLKLDYGPIPQLIPETDSSEI